MNIYLINEDGDSFCIKAETMQKAIDVCFKSYLDSMKDEPDYNEEYETNYYHEQILQSCALVGELKN